MVDQEWLDPKDIIYARNWMAVDVGGGRIVGDYYDVVGNQDRVRAPILSPSGLSYLRRTVRTIQKGLARQERLSSS